MSLPQTENIQSQVIMVYINETISNDLGCNLQPGCQSAFLAFFVPTYHQDENLCGWNKEVGEITTPALQQKAESFPAALHSLWIWSQM